MTHRTHRRDFIKAGAATAALTLSSLTAAAAADKARVAVIGHTGRGNYGHGLDTVWLHVPEATIVGVADPNEGCCLETMTTQPRPTRVPERSTTSTTLAPSALRGSRGMAVRTRAVITVSSGSARAGTTSSTWRWSGGRPKTCPSATRLPSNGLKASSTQTPMRPLS